MGTSYVEDPKGQHYGPGLVIRGKHLVSLSSPAQAAAKWRPLVDKLHMPPLPFFALGASAPLKDDYAAIRELPPNVQLVSLQLMSGDKRQQQLQQQKQRFLVRLAHQFGVGEHEKLSNPVEVDLGSLFVGRRV